MTKTKSKNLIKRQNRIYIGYSDAEYHLLEHRAKEVGCPLAVLVRKLSLKEPVNIPLSHCGGFTGASKVDRVACINRQQLEPNCATLQY